MESFSPVTLSPLDAFRGTGKHKPVINKKRIIIIPSICSTATDTIYLKVETDKTVDSIKIDPTTNCKIV